MALILDFMIQWWHQFLPDCLLRKAAPCKTSILHAFTLFVQTMLFGATRFSPNRELKNLDQHCLFCFHFTRVTQYFGAVLRLWSVSNEPYYLEKLAVSLRTLGQKKQRDPGYIKDFKKLFSHWPILSPANGRGNAKWTFTVNREKTTAQGKW